MLRQLSNYRVIEASYEHPVPDETFDGFKAEAKEAILASLVWFLEDNPELEATIAYEAFAKLYNTVQLPFSPWIYKAIDTISRSNLYRWKNSGIRPDRRVMYSPRKGTGLIEQNPEIETFLIAELNRERMSLNELTRRTNKKFGIRTSGTMIRTWFKRTFMTAKGQSPFRGNIKQYT